jgi:hypothetical protein
MKSIITQLTVIAALSSSALAQSHVVITEIMYNPASAEKKGESEWVEIANVGNQPIEIKDWRLATEGRQKWDKFSCTLAPGGVAVLINADAVKEDEFREAWDEANPDSAAPKLSYQIIPVKWGALSNNPAPDKDMLKLLNDKDEVVCEVKHDKQWPTVKGAGGSSVFMVDFNAAELNSAQNWRASEEGMDGAHHNKTTKVFDKTDCGSPGYVPGLNGNPAATTPEHAKKTRKPTDKSTDSDAGDKSKKPASGDKIDY